MTVFTQAFNLSDNVKYMNFKIDTTPPGGGNATQRTTLTDRQELMHKIQEFITTDIDNQQVPTNKTLGWQRIDGADSAGAIKNDASGVYNVNTGNAVYGFMRAKCYDYSTTGHWKYLRLKMFERNEDSVFGNTDFGQRYKSSPNVLVLRYDVYSDWPGITAEDSAAVIDSINGGSNPAEADGYGGTDLNAGRRNGDLYGNQNAPIGFDAAYNANSGYVNDHNGPASIYWKRSLYGNGNTGLSSPREKNNTEFSNSVYVNNNSIGNYPYGGFRGYGYGHNFYPEFFGVNGFGDSDLSEKNSYGELKLIIDGNGTMWAFGDQDRTGAGGIDSASGTGTHKGVNASGADARYLALFASQHQDDNPEKVDEYATILFAGEYKKEFGEPVSSGYIHNGLKLNAHNFLMNNGVATPPNFKHYESANWTTGSANRGSNQVPLNTALANSFYRNFNSGFNTQDPITNSNYGWHAPSKPVGDAGTTLGAQGSYNNNNTAVDMSGHSFMGDEVIDNAVYGAGTTQNRSRSTGSSHRYRRGDQTWKSRNLGNAAYSNSLSNNYGASTYAGQYGAYYPWLGHDGAQFCLTEYPRRTAGTPTDPSQNVSNTREQVQNYNNYAVPASGREMLSATRLHMGYLGYVGHESKYKAFSLNELFFGSGHGMFGDDGYERLGMLSDDEPGDPARHGVVATSGPGLPMVADYYDSISGNASDSNSNQREFFQEFHPIPMQDSTYSVYEPVLSVGLSRAAQMAEVKYDAGYNNSNGNSTSVMHSNNSQSNNYISGNFTYGEGGTPGGVNKKRSAFAMLGRTYGIKIFGPYTHDKYNFLDAVSVQLDADEFYAVNPNNPVDHWVVPMNHDQVSFLFKK